MSITSPEHSRLRETRDDPVLIKDNVAVLLRRQIIDGKLAPGSQISDKQLARDLDISRTPVREALMTLQVEGLVEVRPRRGTYVFSADAADIAEICAARGLFEADAIRLATASGGEAMVVRLGRLVSKAALAAELNDLHACEVLDTTFHEQLIAMADNRYLAESYDRLAGKMRALRHRLPRSRVRVLAAVQQHRRIVDLISVGQIEDACSEVSKHVANVHRLLVQPISNGPSRVDA